MGTDQLESKEVVQGSSRRQGKNKMECSRGKWHVLKKKMTCSRVCSWVIAPIAFMFNTVSNEDTWKPQGRAWFNHVAVIE